MRKNETMIGSNKVAIQSVYNEGSKLLVNVGLTMIDGSVAWFECVFASSNPVTAATGKHLSSKDAEIDLMKNFIVNNEIAIKEFAEVL